MANKIALLTMCFLGISGSCLAQGRETKPIPIEVYIGTEATALGFYYTIESLQRDITVPAPISLMTIQPKTVSSLDDFVTYVKAALPSVDVKVDSKNPKVLHLIDRALTQIADSRLGTTLDLRYSGLLSGLPPAIGKAMKEDIRYENLTSSSVIFTYAYIKHVDLVYKKTPVREILSDAIFSPDVIPELWYANTLITDGKLETDIQFYGPIRRTP